MPNVNPQAIAFGNQKARPWARSLLVAISKARDFEAFYAAQSADTLFPNDADVLEDGSATDGRPRLQNQVVRALRTAAQDLLTWAAIGNPTREARLRSIVDNGIFQISSEGQ